MSDINSKATVTLNVNGQQAQQTLAQLKQNALNLESAMAKAAAAGNKTDLKRLRRELSDTKRQMRDIESSTLQVESVLRNLDKATPRELNKTLQTLNRQLEYVERNSEAWKAHTAKIKQVKEELAKVNSELRNQESFWERFNRKLNDWQTSIMGMIAAITGLVMAGRSAVNKYADMEEELANTRKYTGLTEDAVVELNDKFKQMDTRTPREKLNELAQEAGRLGKNTLESVQGYVEAADIINVALVDLGDGATQTIAKLSNIFGVEKVMSTKDAMLSVGSAVNVLSQNCTASKQYLVEFTQRMAGVGAQADLTIPQLLAYGATLDANGQKTEMSASALGKLTMMLFQKPKEVAKQVGLDVEQFTETLKKGTNEGLLMFLERIQQLGSKDGLAVLAPLFKDLGMDGVRMSQVLATLAEHLDMVKWEQEEANKAFNEATSASHEYAIFNNTVQAGIDKAKKRITELAVELGEKLLPVMKHVMTSTSATLRLLNIVVSFFIEHKTAILTATAAFVAYNIAIHAQNILFKAQYGWLLVTELAHKAVTSAQAIGKVMTTGLTHAYERLVWQTRGATTAQQAFNRALQAAGSKTVIGMVITGVVLLGTALYNLYQRMVSVGEAQKTLNKIKDDATVNAQEEIDTVNTLAEAARNENLALDERRRAIERLNSMIPGYNGQLDETTMKYRENTTALKNYIDQLVRKYEIEGAKETIKKVSAEISQLRVNKNEAEKALEQAKEDQRVINEQMRDNDGTPRPQTSGGAYAPSSVHAQIGASGDVAARQSDVSAIDKKISAKQAIIDKITEVYGDDIQKHTIKEQTAIEGNTSDNDNPQPTGTDNTKTKAEDKFKAEKEWKEREEALNKIAYAKGEKNYEQYTQRMDEIAMEFYDRELAHTDLTEQERITIQGDRAEEQIKQQEKTQKKSLEEERAFYNTALATEKQRYIDGEISLETYNEASELLEMQHLKRIVNLYKEGTAERLNAEKAYTDKLFQNQKRRQENEQKEQEKIEKHLKKYKDKFFGDTPTQKTSNYNEQLKYLNMAYLAEVKMAGDNAKEKKRIDEAYRKAKIALMREYDQEELRENQNFLQNFNDDMQEWLESDMGKAVTQTAQVLVDGISSIFQQLSTLIQAELEIETAALESKYAKEISLAEGNNYKVNKLEKEKQAQLKKVKDEANKKMFAMQVIQAVAQTATAALNAYSSAAAIPVVGWVMGPVAASLAAAAGALQIAAIKKQQQASASQGYSEGGFTPDGDRNKPVGVVHAGEWVASQDLVKNPRVRPMLEALDYAQRTNTIGSLTASDVGRSISAPMIAAQNSATALSPVIKVESSQPSDDLAKSSEVAEVLKNLNKRLSEPFVTVNTVTGDTGIKKAQDEYEKLIANKSPKKR